MIQFKYTHLELPTAIVPEAVVPIEFIFEGDKALISKASPSCGCTAECKIEDGKITALFTEQDAKSQNKNSYPTGLYKFKKTINVFMQDKTTVSLTFGGNVLLN